MRPSEGRISLWPVGLIVLFVTLAAVSITPSVKLNPVPPADFVTLHASARGAKAAMAAEYWEVALRVIQWKYARASALPEQVPADFRLADGRPANVEDQGVRVAYWEKLREEWLRPENWHTDYSFDLTWPIRNGRSLLHAVLRFLKQT
jgi:hypothetical protein